MFHIYHGEDAFSQDEQLAALKAGLGDPANVELNTAVFDGRAAFSLSALRAACDALPFLAPRRMVIVEGLLARLLGSGEGEDEADGADAPKGRGKAGGTAREVLEPLGAYLPELPETTDLVFLERRTLPAKHPLLKLADGRIGTARLFSAPKPEALPGWIVQRARQYGGAFTPPAAQLLAQYTGGELRALDQEVAKLVAYVNAARPVTPADVQVLVPAAGQGNIFAMVDALGQRDGRQATRLLHQLLDVGEHPLGLLAMIVRQFRLLLQVKELHESGLPAPEIARRLSLHGFVADKLTKQARHFTMPQLERIYKRLLDVDVAIKSGETEAEVALDLFVASLL